MLRVVGRGRRMSEMMSRMPPRVHVSDTVPSEVQPALAASFEIVPSVRGADGVVTMLTVSVDDGANGPGTAAVAVHVGIVALQANPDDPTLVDLAVGGTIDLSILISNLSLLARIQATGFSKIGSDLAIGC